MPSTSHPRSTLFSRFFRPLTHALDQPHASRRDCPQLPDADWLLIGILRTLSTATTGRAWLQFLRNSSSLPAPTRSHFFETLKSKRRLALCSQVNSQLVNNMRSEVRDPLWRICPGAR